jgi:hypothetical protein
MRLFWFCWFGIALPAAGLAETPPASPTSRVESPVTDEFRRLLEQLDAGEFSVRQRAEQRLYAHGAAAIPALEEAALTGDPGRLPPVVRVLEHMLIDGCPDLADAAERALERLAFSDVTAAMQRARGVLSGNHHLRMRRAVAAIRELGGRVVFMPLDGPLRGNPFWGMGGDAEFGIPGQPGVTIHIWLLRGWQGSEEGLWHLTRLEDAWSARLWKIEVTNVVGSRLSMEGVQALAARLPHLQVDERGASLGIMSSPTGDCQVTTILPGGAASRAGLTEGDVIRQLDDIPINNFTELVGNLLKYEPDTQALLKVERDGQVYDVPITLGGWEDLNVTDPNRIPAPLPDLRPPPLLPDLNDR